MHSIGGCIYNTTNHYYDKLSNGISRSHRKGKRDCMMRIGKKTYQKGDLVLLYYPVRRRGLIESLLHRWIGPYKVIDQLRTNSYKLERIGSGMQIAVHVVRMRRYTTISLAEDQTPRPATQTSQAETEAETQSPPSKTHNPRPAKKKPSLLSSFHATQNPPSASSRHATQNPLSTWPHHATQNPHLVHIYPRRGEVWSVPLMSVDTQPI